MKIDFDLYTILQSIVSLGCLLKYQNQPFNMDIDFFFSFSFSKELGYFRHYQILDT